MQVMRNRSLPLGLAVVLVFTLASISLLYLKQPTTTTVFNHSKQTFLWQRYSRWPRFNISTSCYSKSPPSSISEYINHWDEWRRHCLSEAALFDNIFEMETRSQRVVFDSKEYQDKVLEWLGGDTALYRKALNQYTTSIYNRYTAEETLYNPLRALRPIRKPKMPVLDYIMDLARESAKSCDFCNYKRYTARDVKGRLENDYAYAAANTFRYDSKHQLIMPRIHHPLNWTENHILSMFSLALQWVEQEHASVPEYSFPLIDWDLLPHGGASQVHPHLQVILEPQRYTGGPESWRRAAETYYTDFRSNYFTDISSIHQSLGLAVQHKSAIAFTTLTPKRDNEVVIVSEHANEDHFELLYMVLRTFIEDLKIYPFSLAMTIPQLASKSKRESLAGVVPAFTRVVTRGVAGEVRSDISSVELFSFYSVNSDPFRLIKTLRNSVKRRAPLLFNP